MANTPKNTMAGWLTGIEVCPGMAGQNRFYQQRITAYQKIPLSSLKFTYY